MLHGYREHRDLRYVNEKRAAYFYADACKRVILEGEFSYRSVLLLENFISDLILVFSFARNSVILKNF